MFRDSCILFGTSLHRPYETNLNDYVRTNLIRWLLNGGVSDTDWTNFQNELTGKCKIGDLQKVYQDAYDRFTAQ